MTEVEELNWILAQHEKLTTCANSKSWSGYRGMVFVNLLRDYLEKHLPSSVGLVCRGWVEGCPNELDILVVRGGSSPIELTPAYRKSDVLCIIEAKASGIFWRLDEAGQQLLDLSHKIESRTGRPFAYVTRYENERLSAVTKRVLGEKAFILTSGSARNPQMHETELPRLVQSIKTTCVR